MGVLPSLRRGRDRWWLPLSTEASETIALVLMAGVNSDQQTLMRKRVRELLCTDPPSLIFATLSWPHESASLDDLVDWLIQHAGGRFASGDAFLGLPDIREADQQRWQKLRDHFRTLPIESWMDNASLWLEVLGPVVPAAWRDQWPSIYFHDHVDQSPKQQSTSVMLQQLARLTQRQVCLEKAFDERIEKVKLGALKQLAYGLSHEINNPLANISTRAQQLQRGEEDETRIAILDRIVEQVYRAHDMISDLMFFANPPRPNQTSIDLNETVQRVTDGFTEEAERQAIRLEVKTHNEEAFVWADEQMIGEALRALLRNSIDAIGCEGTIVVTVVRNHSRWLIHVADSGPGLSDLAREHAFEPYFSGREAGRGLGLGLCRAYRIAKLHEGDVRLAGGTAGCVATLAIRAKS